MSEGEKTIASCIGLIILGLALVLTTTSPATVKAHALSYGIYWDAQCTQPVTHIDWGTVYPEIIYTKTAYIRNEEDVVWDARQTYTFMVRNINPPELADYLYLSWDNGGKRYPNDTWQRMRIFQEVGEVSEVTFYLWVYWGAPAGSFDFEYHVNAHLLGDTNRNGYVDRFDIDMISTDWGKHYQSEEPGYNPYDGWYYSAIEKYYNYHQTDVNFDLKMDIFDLVARAGSPQPPKANFVYTPKHPVEGETITFDASTSHDPDGDITDYSWNFGDGNETSINTATITHVYTTSNTYAVNLTVTDDEELNHSITKSITVREDSNAPTTLHDYDDLWHTADFTITLTATDNMSDIAETYYRINNDGPTKSVSADGQPLIAIESANNTLEYWSIDNADNEELPHKILTEIKLDKTTPTGSIIINNNDPFTTSTSVTLTLTATDDTSGVYQVRYSNDDVWDNEPWEIPSPTKTWTLTPGTDIKTVYYQIQDNAGLNSTTYSDIIIYLGGSGSTGSVAINDGANYTTSTSATLTLSSAGAPFDITEMRFSNNNTTYGEWKTYATSESWNLQDGDGIKTVYVQFRDNAGLNYTYSGTIVLDTTQPTGSISMRAHTHSTSVKLRLKAEDATSGVARMHFSDDGINWNDWEPYAASKPWILTTGDETKTVYIQYKDNAGLISPTYQNTIILDTKKPVANAGVNQTVAENIEVTLSGSDSWDENDIANFTWAFTDVTPKTLNDKNPTYTFATHGTYLVTLTVQDAAGNTATDTVEITVLLDTDDDRIPDVTDPDDDNDGMPDTWETENGLNPLNTTDTSLDPDGDGLTNLEEYQRDTNPNVSDAQAFPWWILSAVVAVMLGVGATLVLWKRRNRSSAFPENFNHRKDN